ncbi:MAG: TonB-dependent siderophore receptor [Puniceicoccaceae bacterium 5H]|nr:MAG: TonB-dependent siderophore receptor [Puniceicoccaceae bacterium 5H]
MNPRSCCSLALLLAAGSGVLCAQDVATPEDEVYDIAPVTIDARDPFLYPMDEAPVTTKIDVSLLELPISVSVLTREVLDDQAVLDLQDALKNVAGASPYGYVEGFDYFRLRGFEANDYVFQDGLMADPSGWFQEELFGVERVEVLKGPASVFYGQVAPGGIVNLVSKFPTANTFGEFSATGGSDSFREITADFGGPIRPGSQFSYRMVGFYRTQESFTDFVDESERSLLFPSVRWQSATGLTLTAYARYQKDIKTMSLPLPAEGTVLPNPNGKLPIDRYAGEPDFQNEGDTERTHLGYELEYPINEVFTFRQKLRGSWNDADFTSIYPMGWAADEDTGETNYRLQERMPYIGLSNYDHIVTDVQLEAHYHTGSLEHRTLTGVQYTHFEESITNYYGALDPIDLFDPEYGAEPMFFGPIDAHHEDTWMLNAYALEHLQVTKALAVMGGLSYGYYETDREDTLYGGTLSSDDGTWTPQAGLTYRFLPEILDLIPEIVGYVNYAQSFKPIYGSVTADGGNPDPEKARQWEAGFKTQLQNGRLAANLAFFQITRENVATEVPDQPGTVDVTGEQRSQGIELEVTGKITSHWDLLASYAYIDSRVREDAVVPVGDRSINVPYNSLTLWTRYGWDTGWLDGFSVGTGFRAYSNQPGDLPNTFALPGYTVWDAVVAYERDHYWARLKFDNLFDREYYQGSNGRSYVQPGKPIQMRLTMGYRY